MPMQPVKRSYQSIEGLKKMTEEEFEREARGKLEKLRDIQNRKYFINDRYTEELKELVEEAMNERRTITTGTSYIYNPYYQDSSSNVFIVNPDEPKKELPKPPEEKQTRKITLRGKRK